MAVFQIVFVLVAVFAMNNNVEAACSADDLITMITVTKPCRCDDSKECESIQDTGDVCVQCNQRKLKASNNELIQQTLTETGYDTDYNKFSVFSASISDKCQEHMGAALKDMNC
ncbi:hypothetical protein CHUAL_002104 [Chamberlinius hualienensis]